MGVFLENLYAMKHLLTLCFLAFSSQIIAQSTIIGLSVSPSNPTVNDMVTLYAECQFPSGDCIPDFTGHNVNGFTIEASGHHCLGPLAFICSYTDTFEIGQLPEGNYTFDFTLTTGFGGPGCSPGIVPDDNDQLQFTVSPSVGIEEPILAGDLIFPNPTEGILNFKKPTSHASILTDLQGKKLLEINAGVTSVDISALPSGVYLLDSISRKVRIVKH